MPTYTLLADVEGQQIQGPQELSSIWGAVREEIESLGGVTLQSYVLLGENDFQIVFEADEETVLEIALAVQRQGLDTETMRAIPTDRLGEMVDDR